MLDQRRAAAQSEPTREQLFTERYEIMLGWALRLTNQQRDAAEDLVQDAFVQFMLARTQLEEIENINGYLRRLLRNMHLSRVTRVSQRLQDTALSIADYDTLRLGWTAIEPPRRMQAAEELQQICAYACFRKESSRAGSVLILRFFLDYFPTEIASVLGSSRHCVDQWQRLARREVKVFMDDPSRLRFVDAKISAAGSWTVYPSSDNDLMIALRAMIFSSRQGACLSTQELEAAYAAGKTDALSTAELAHIVSCRSCLDAVNAMLALPLLAERYPAEDCSHDEPPRDAGGSGGSGGISSVLPKRFQRQLREIREHKPSELRIAVNGVALSSFKVNSDFCELDLNVPGDEPVEFVEILSEQDVQLLFLSVNESAIESEQWAEIELSDGRTLELRVQPNDGPRLHVVYNDPVLEDFSSTGVVIEGFLSSPLTLVPKARAKRWVDVLKRVFSRDVAVEESGGSSATTSLGLLGQPPVQRRHVWNSPALLTVLLAAVVVGAFLVYKSNLNTTPIASSLLAQAIVAETDRARVPDQVVHESINLEIRRSSEGALVARHTIASWQNGASHQRVQRLYDESGRLVAAASRAADGTRTIYRHHAKVPQSRGAAADALLLDLEEVWQLTPSVQDFNAIIAEPTAATVEQRTTSYVVSFEKERTVGASRLVKATLTLARSDLRPIEQTLVVQRGEELREYKFVVTESELVPAKEVQNVFEIEPEFLGKEPAGKSSAGESVVRKDADPASTTSTSAFASTELEIDVAYLLNQAKADRNEQVALTRSASGSLRVEGVVDTAERRAEFLRVLGPVSNNPAVSIQIRTVAEAANQKVAAEKQSVREFEETSNTSAVEDELRVYFEKRGLARDAVDESVRSYTSRVVNHGYRALFHAVELKRLVERFARVDMRTVTPDARAKWVAMMRDHANACARETVALRRELEPVFFSGAAAESVEDLSINSDADLARAIERLHKLTLANNEAIGHAFTISARSSAAAFKASQFKRSLEVAARLSDRISEYSP
jgi:RNA polymerase sigma factor (sigma-70 family)